MQLKPTEECCYIGLVPVFLSNEKSPPTSEKQHCTLINAPISINFWHLVIHSLAKENHHCWHCSLFAILWQAAVLTFVMGRLHGNFESTDLFYNITSGKDVHVACFFLHSSSAICISRGFIWSLTGLDRKYWIQMVGQALQYIKPLILTKEKGVSWLNKAAEIVWRRWEIISSGTHFKQPPERTPYFSQGRAT